MEIARGYDPLVVPLIAAADETACAAVIDGLIARAIPTIDAIVARYRGGGLSDDDLRDLRGAVMLRLLRRLCEASRGEGAPIVSFDDFVARLAFNAANDALRRRFPQRTRLKNQIRYALTHDPRFALWHASGGLIAGEASHAGREPMPLTRRSVDQASEDLGETLAAIFAAAGTPLLLEEVVDTVAALWNVEEASHLSVEAMASSEQPATTSIEQRSYLTAVWSEIRQLRPNQRAALLLNLRDSEGVSAIELFVLLGLATIDEIAEALQMPAERLAGIWNTLPLDDLTIAGMLGVNRQQVINLRRAARDRLGRRMKMR